MSKLRFKITNFSFILFISFFSLLTNASLITVDISNNTTVTFDDGFSLGTSGDFTLMSGSTTSTSTFDADSNVTGDNPLSGSLTETGDGAGFSGSVDVQDEEYTTGFDSKFEFTNNSLINSYELFFKLDYSNLVDSLGGEAFAYSYFQFFVNSSEMFYSDLFSDTANDGNLINGNETGVFGGELTDSATELFSIILTPAELLIIDTEWTLEGGDFDAGNSKAEFSSFFSLESVVNLTNPTTSVPEPNTVFLLLISILALCTVNKKFIKNN
jgi:hypothetical protein